NITTEANNTANYHNITCITWDKEGGLNVQVASYKDADTRNAETNNRPMFSKIHTITKTNTISVAETYVAIMALPEYAGFVSDEI
ncbi:MAG: hypothetical protein ACUZ8H_03365, partial [Candidatus Anammoxibacter sp.]